MTETEAQVETKHFQELKEHIQHNYQIADFYYDFYEETREEKFLNKSKSVDLCCKYWDIDFYHMQNVKDIQRVNLCHDKFCFNCQSMLASKRQLRFAPKLNELRKAYMVAHMVVTVPNCEFDELLPLLDRMYQKFPHMIRFLKGQKKVRGVDFLQYGYGGAVRGLEVTQNKETKQFHPHFHCMVLFRPDLDLKGKYKNSYSYDDGRLVRKFSELEVLLQKVWYLLVNDQRVTAEAIAELKEGYSVIIDDSKGHYHEAFKYACKGAFDESKGAFIYNGLTFRTLYEALYSRRMIQGYGALHNFNDLNGEILESELQEIYAKIVEELQAIEKPEKYVESLDDIIEQSSYCKYISRSNLKRLLIERQKGKQNGGENESISSV